MLLKIIQWRGGNDDVGGIGGTIPLGRVKGDVCAMNSELWMGHGHLLCGN